MACTDLPRKGMVVLAKPVASSPVLTGGAVPEGGEKDTPARSRKVGAKSITVENDRSKLPGLIVEWNVRAGGFTMHGTSIPP